MSKKLIKSGMIVSGMTLASRVMGLVRDVVHNLHRPLQGRRVLLLGAGGATRGALLPILAQGPSEVVIVNRTVSKAQELVAVALQHQTGAVPVRGMGYADLSDASFDVVFNATSASLTAEPVI